jgi:hypothetical protein
LTESLNKYGLRKKIIAYVKYEGSNLNAMITVLKVVVNYEFLGLKEKFQGTCFGHGFSKACQYGTIEEKVCKHIKSIEVNLQKCITWRKKFGKGRQEWNKACFEIGIGPRKLNTLVKTK